MDVKGMDMLPMGEGIKLYAKPGIKDFPLPEAPLWVRILSVFSPEHNFFYNTYSREILVRYKRVFSNVIVTYGFVDQKEITIMQDGNDFIN